MGSCSNKSFEASLRSPHSRREPVPLPIGQLVLRAKSDVGAHRKSFGFSVRLWLDFGVGSGCGVGGGAGQWQWVEGRVYRTIHPFAGCIALVLVAVGLSRAALAADDFPLTGNYTQNVACKGDGSDAADAKVTISAQEIVSNVGVCTILDMRKDGDSYAEHVECKFPSGPLMGNITFTPKPDNTVEFVDSNGAYKAVLHRCPGPTPSTASSTAAANK